MLSTVMKSLREGLAATRIADFVNQKLRNENLIHNDSSSGAVICIDTLGQTTFAGVGKIYEDFKRTGKLMNYSGFGKEAKTFYEKDFEAAAVRMLNYDQTFYKLPYDVRKSKHPFGFLVRRFITV